MNLSNSILIDKVEIIEKTDYFTLSINQKKNRLYLYYTSKPIFFVEEISEYIPAFEKALSRLQPGFSVLSDKRYCLPYCRAVADHFGIRIIYSWREGGIKREIYRENQG